MVLVVVALWLRPWWRRGGRPRSRLRRRGVELRLRGRPGLHLLLLLGRCRVAIIGRGWNLPLRHGLIGLPVAAHIAALVAELRRVLRRHGAPGIRHRLRLGRRRSRRLPVVFRRASVVRRRLTVVSRCLAIIPRCPAIVPGCLAVISPRLTIGARGLLAIAGRRLVCPWRRSRGARSARKSVLLRIRLRVLPLSTLAAPLRPGASRHGRASVVHTVHGGRVPRGVDLRCGCARVAGCLAKALLLLLRRGVALRVRRTQIVRPGLRGNTAPAAVIADAWPPIAVDRRIIDVVDARIVYIDDRPIVRDMAVVQRPPSQPWP